MIINKYARIYFWGGSILFTSLSTIINIYIIEWNKVNLIIGIFYLFIQLISSWTSSEILLKALLILFHKVNKINTIHDIGKTSFIINYNLKAYNEEEIDKCFLNLYHAFIGNMGINSIGVLISATTDPILITYEISKLIYYRELLYNYLYKIGLEYINNINNINNIDDIDDIDDNFDDISWLSKLKIPNHLLKKRLSSICRKRTLDFILLRRTSNTLKKCGQYQDLITLSIGYTKCYTYENKKLYGKNARSKRPLFISPDNNTENYNRILRKNFQYTIVLDSDTVVPKNSIIKLIGVANANPEYTIIQPQINLYGDNTLFSKLQIISQEQSNIITKYTCSFFNHCSFFGKGLIRNSDYLKYCIGTSSSPVEYVPTDALSHDTFEAMAVPVLYTPNIYFKENPPETYISWNIRELRWNIGDLIVARHIYPYLLCRKKSLPHSKHKYNLSFAKGYFALSSFRVIMMRPILLIFIILITFIPMKFSYIPMLYMIITIIIIPSIITFRIKTFYNSILLLFISIIQFTPEPAIGSVRLFISLYTLFKNKFKWLPSSLIEYQISKKGIIYYSLLYLMPFTTISSILLPFLYQKHVALTFFFISNIILPIYSIITGLNYNKYKKRSNLQINNHFRINIRSKSNTLKNSNITLAQLSNIG